MSDLIATLRAIIREELSRYRAPELGVVTEVFANAAPRSCSPTCAGSRAGPGSGAPLGHDGFRTA